MRFSTACIFILIAFAAGYEIAVPTDSPKCPNVDEPKIVRSNPSRICVSRAEVDNTLAKMTYDLMICLDAAHQLKQGLDYAAVRIKDQEERLDECAQDLFNCRYPSE